MVESKPKSEWTFTLGDDFVFLHDWEHLASHKEYSMPWYIADLVVGKRYFDMKEHYYSLKSIIDKLPDGVPLELEDIYRSYVELMNALSDRGRYVQGRYNYSGIGELLIGIHLHHYHLKNRLVGQGYRPNDPKLKALLDAGQAEPQLIKG